MTVTSTPFHSDTQTIFEKMESRWICNSEMVSAYTRKFVSTSKYFCARCQHTCTSRRVSPLASAPTWQSQTAHPQAARDNTRMMLPEDVSSRTATIKQPPLEDRRCPAGRGAGWPDEARWTPHRAGQTETHTRTSSEASSPCRSSERRGEARRGRARRCSATKISIPSSDTSQCETNRVRVDDEVLQIEPHLRRPVLQEKLEASRGESQLAIAADSQTAAGRVLPYMCSSSPARARTLLMAGERKLDPVARWVNMLCG